MSTNFKLRTLLGALTFTTAFALGACTAEVRTPCPSDLNDWVGCSLGEPAGGDPSPSGPKGHEPSGEPNEPEGHEPEGKGEGHEGEGEGPT